MPPSTATPLARAQVVVVIIPTRDWAGLMDWVRASADERHEFSRHGTYTLAVPLFDHSSQQPLVSLLIKEGTREVALVGAAYRGRYQAAAGLSQLVLHDAKELPRSSAVKDIRHLRERVFTSNQRVRQHFTDQIMQIGGLLPPATSRAVIAEIESQHDLLMTRLAEAFPSETDSLRDVDAQRRFVFQQQRDAVLLALSLVGIGDRDDLQLCEPPNVTRSFLDQLPQSFVSEEQVLRADAQGFPGMAAMQGAHIDRRIFTSGDRRLDLVFAHRERLEEITGADFIYYNATFGSFVLVQYKLLEAERGQEFYRINQHMRDQMASMRSNAPLPSPVPDAAEPNAFRLGHEACFWKFVPKQPNLATDQSLIPGYYLPLSLLQKSVQQGPRGGELIKPAELPRALSNTAFATLVRDAWIGTAGAQTNAREQLIRTTLGERRGITLAIHNTEED